MWTTLKVVLSISLVRDLGDVRGLFMYKMVILRFLLTFVQPPVFPVTESTGIEMLKKVRYTFAILFYSQSQSVINQSD